MRETRLTVHYSSAEQRAAAAERHARRQARRVVQVRAHHDALGDRRAAARQAGARAHVRVGSLPALTTDARLARSQPGRSSSRCRRRGRYMHVRTGNARPQPAVPTGAGLKFYLRLLLSC